MNFTYTVTKPPDGQFGSRMKNNTWTGMVRMLQNQEVDIGILYINKLNIAMFSIRFDNYAILQFQLLQLLVLLEQGVK